MVPDTFSLSPNARQKHVMEVDVDGRPVDPQQLEMHYQNDPFPGGSRYVVCVREQELVDDILKRFAVPTQQPLSPSDAIHLFMVLRGYVSFYYGRSKPLLFWANTVESIAVVNGALEVRGICSPHVTTGEEKVSGTFLT